MGNEMTARESQLYETTKAEFLQLRKSISEKLADGQLKMRELFSLMREFLEGANAILKHLTVTNFTKEERVAVITSAMIEWWDTDLEKLDLPGPDAILDPMIRAAIPGIVKLLLGWIGM